MIGHAEREICFNPQNWAVTRHQYGVLRSFFRRLFAGKPVVSREMCAVYWGYATPFIAFVNDLPMLRLLLLLLLLCHMYITSRGDNATHTDPLRVPSGSHSLHMWNRCREHKFLAPLYNIWRDRIQLSPHPGRSHCWRRHVLLWSYALWRSGRRQRVRKGARSAVWRWCRRRVLVNQSWLFTGWHGHIIDSHLWCSLLRPVTINKLARMGCSGSQRRRACLSSIYPLFLWSTSDWREQKPGGLCWVWCVSGCGISRTGSNRTILWCPWSVELWWWLEWWRCLWHCLLYRSCRRHHRWSNRSYFGRKSTGCSGRVAWLWLLLLVKLSYLRRGTLERWLYWLWLDM